MPDEATTRDVALKLEAWAASLSEPERKTVESWMAIGVDTTEPITSITWWFNPSGGSDRPLSREGH